MKQIWFLGSLVVFAMFSPRASAALVNGRVVDAATGEVLIGASVYNDTYKVGVVTDVEGHFAIDLKQLPDELTVSYVGYQSKKVRVKDGDDDPVDVRLEEDHHSLNEVVVVGYGTQSRTQLTGSVTTVRGDVFSRSQAVTLDGALSGQVAGLHITAASGQPGADSQIRIRGGNSVNASNEPLYVIDGFIYYKDAAANGTGIGAIEGSLNPLATINPHDIESIEVLKDVSATAIYGSRGANGVILVTTRKGRDGGGKAQVSYNYGIGFSQISKRLHLLNASQWAQYQKTYWSNKGGYTDEQIAQLGKGTDWQDAVLRTAPQQSHELSVSGATEKNRYAFSANYTDQQGIVINSGFQRYNFHLNSDWTLTKGLKLGIQATYGRSRQRGLTTTEEQVYNSSPYSAGITNSFVYALLMPPVINVYNSDGSYNFTNPYEYAYFAIGNHAANPVYDLRESVAENINNYLLTNIWSSYRLGDFTLKAAVALSSEHLTQNYFSGAYTSLGLATEGIGGTGNRHTDIWQQEYTVTWDKDLNDYHHLDALAGFTPINGKGVDQSYQNAENLEITHNSVDRIEIRYAEVLLIKAEALVQLGRNSEAAAPFNQLRQRAGIATVSAPTFDQIKREWDYEFTYEQFSLLNSLRWKNLISSVREVSHYKHFSDNWLDQATYTADQAAYFTKVHNHLVAKYNNVRGKNYRQPIPTGLSGEDLGITVQNPGF